jgi:uncharacterized protein YdhG (YjbR/CyaY superfamily)
MKKEELHYQNTDEYIAQFPPEIQAKLQQLRATIKAAAPEAVEKISYGMPAFDQNGVLAYFAAFKDHLSFFPTGSGRAAFGNELDKYPGGKGTIQLSLSEPLPLDLVARIVKFRVEENKTKAAAQKK